MNSRKKIRLKRELKRVKAKKALSKIKLSETHPIVKRLDEFMLDHSKIWGTESERKEYLYRSVARLRAVKKRAGKCYWPECKERSIKNSHTVPESMLRNITLDAHVFGIDNNQDSGTPEFRRFGVGHAMTFPGYCKKHEDVFNKSFESHGGFDNNYQLYLQTLRTLHCKKFRNETTLQSLIIGKQEFEEKSLEWFKNYLDSQFDHDDEIVSVRGPVNEIVEKGIRDIEQESKCIEELIDPLEKFILSEGKFDAPVLHFVNKFDEILPLALSGYMQQGYYLEGKNRWAPIVGHVFALKSGITLFSLVGLELDKEFIQSYFSRGCFREVSSLSMIESWMMHGTDHWCVGSQLFNTLSDEKKAAIMNVFFDFEKTMAHFPSVSIFDELRKKFIDQCEQTSNKNFQDRLILEERKLLEVDIKVDLGF